MLSNDPLLDGALRRPSGFGVRQSSGALGNAPGMGMLSERLRQRLRGSDERARGLAHSKTLARVRHIAGQGLTELTFQAQETKLNPK